MSFWHLIATDCNISFKSNFFFSNYQNRLMISGMTGVIKELAGKFLLKCILTEINGFCKCFSPRHDMPGFNSRATFSPSSVQINIIIFRIMDRGTET
jgi:hypothetical protein